MIERSWVLFLLGAGFVLLQTFLLCVLDQVPCRGVTLLVFQLNYGCLAVHPWAKLGHYAKNGKKQLADD